MTCRRLPGLDQVVIITGSNTGVGYETAKALVNMGAHVIMGEKKKTPTHRPLYHTPTRLPINSAPKNASFRDNNKQSRHTHTYIPVPVWNAEIDRKIALDFFTKPSVVSISPCPILAPPCPPPPPP